VRRHGYALLLAVPVLLASGSARAHESGASTLHLRVQGSDVSGEWELTARDARALLGLPLDRTPDALSDAESAQLAGLFVERVAVEADGRPCPWQLESGPTPTAGEPPTVVTAAVARCGAPMQALRLVYPLLFDLDPKHRGYYSLKDARHVQAGLFRAEAQEADLAVVHPDPWRSLREYLTEGARHVWEGPDHLLFLFSLLLPAVFGGASRRDAVQRPGARGVVVEIVGVVTAFTVAHSITLAMAVFAIVRLPSRPVEVVIAISVFAAAWNNLRPFMPVRTAWLAFGFGLVHGFGFAGALVRLGLPPDARIPALVGFNLGVEAGQLALVGLWLAVALPIRNTPTYRRGVVPVASLAIAWIAAVWTVERAFGLELLPWP